ncbi:hypothetical protein FTUN_3007 [Frigoriglobus tundricola]|uniref:Uncharacterized protein n=1 Tax=Frigoriglobus tundricola TaxID=2774151 RepID=A0A6M5YNF7_9BACT|nr:hypothetical protein FTUN_3007 [Frigoriglobus tundricola]
MIGSLVASGSNATRSPPLNKHADGLAKLTALNFQTREDDSLRAA